MKSTIMDEQDAILASLHRNTKSAAAKRKQQPVIKAILEIISSKRDQSGNKYWAFRITAAVKHDNVVLRKLNDLFNVLLRFIVDYKVTV